MWNNAWSHMRRWPRIWTTQSCPLKWGFMVQCDWHLTRFHTYISLHKGKGCQSYKYPCNCVVVFHLLLPQIRSLKCSARLGSAQVFAADTKTFLFLLKENVLLYPQEKYSQGIWCTLQKLTTLHLNTVFPHNEPVSLTLERVVHI